MYIYRWAAYMHECYCHCYYYATFHENAVVILPNLGSHSFISENRRWLLVRLLFSLTLSPVILCYLLFKSLWHFCIYIDLAMYTYMHVPEEKKTKWSNLWIGDAYNNSLPHPHTNTYTHTPILYCWFYSICICSKLLFVMPHHIMMMQKCIQ